MKEAELQFGNNHKYVRTYRENTQTYMIIYDSFYFPNL